MQNNELPTKSSVELIFIIFSLNLWMTFVYNLVCVQVRIYTPKHVHSQLEDALQDYTRASVGISPKGRLLIPKLLYMYARENVEDSDILDWVCNLLPSNQVAVVFDCIQQRRHRILASRNFNIIPLDFTFRYLFPAEVGLKKIFWFSRKKPRASRTYGHNFSPLK